MKTIDILLKRGVIAQEQVKEARREAQKTGLALDKALVRLGVITEEDIAKTMADETGVPYMDLSGYIIDPEVIKLVPEATAKKFKVVPLFKIGSSLTIAMVKPQDIVAIDEVRKRSRFTTVEPVLSMGKDIERAIEQYYGVTGTVEELIKSIAKPRGVGGKEVSAEQLAEWAEEIPVIKLVNLLVMQAVKERASDIHIEPEEELLRIRYRVDGVLHEVTELPAHLQSAVASRIKVLSNMDIAEKRKPQDGRFMMKMQDKEIDLRVSTFPTIHGENVVLRILDKSSAIMRLAELGMAPGDLKKYDELIKRPHGIILVTGPTGSGKTTTLYASLSTINSIEKNIITIEDPVEYEIPLIRQTQINPKAGLTFATGLRNILRQDPDMVMVGEVRDRETAEIAIQAALTGHLVFSTLHTNDAPGGITRLIDMEVETFLISSSVIGILAQRLVRTICSECKEKYSPSEEELKDIGLSPVKWMVFYRGKGCRRCRQSGYRGRIGIFELLVVDEEIRKLIMAKTPTDEIRKKAQEKGMITLRDDGLEKVKNGFTTVEEVLRVTEEE